MTRKPRPAAAERVRQIARAGLACFIDAGYRLTQIAHVTERMDVSIGLVYRYVESKEALFHIAALEAAGLLPDDLELPVKVSGLEQTAALLREAVDQARDWPVLQSALAAKWPADLKSEARAIAAELYDVVSDRAQLLWLLDRCSRDIPALAVIFDDQIRNRYMQDLVGWIVRRKLIATASPAETMAVARGAMEAVAWLARNRRGDRTAATITEDEARDAALRIFANAFDYD
jgi:AcrR family transcriptional regulator